MYRSYFFRVKRAFEIYSFNMKGVKQIKRDKQDHETLFFATTLRGKAHIYL